MVSHGLLLPTRGVVLEHSDPTDLAARMRRDVVELAQRAEAAGFDGAWVGDSVLAKPRLEPFTTLAAVAAATDDLHLGTGVYLPTLRDPVHIAHQTSTLSLLSDERLRIGVGVARGPAVEREYGALGVEYSQRGRVLDEALCDLDRLWTGDHERRDGTAAGVEDATIGFPPREKPGVYVAYRTLDQERGFPRHVRARIRDHADGWLPISIPPEVYELGLEQAQEAVEGTEREARFDPAYYQNIVIAETEAEAIQEAREFLLNYYSRWDELSDDDIRTQGAFGPPAVVEAHMARYREAGVETFVTRFPATDQRGQLEKFAEITG